MKPILAVHSSHDFTIAIYLPETDSIKIIDASTIAQEKHFTSWTNTHNINTEMIAKLLVEAKYQFGIENDFSTVVQKRDVIITKVQEKNGELTEEDIKIIWERNPWNPWNISTVKTDVVVDVSEDPGYWHHINHITCGYSQSSFDKAVCLSFDGGGDDTDCAISLIDNGIIKKYEKLPYHLSKIYERVGAMLPILAGNTKNGLDVAGKLMGLAAYGEIDAGAKRRLMDLMLMEPNEHLPHTMVPKGEVAKELVGKVREALIPLEHARDAAATAQAAFEEMVLEIVRLHCEPFFNDYDHNLVLTGGSALNINANQLIRETFDINTYVPANPDDHGLSFGLLMRYLYDNDVVPCGKKYNVDNSGLHFSGDVDSLCNDDNVIQLQDVVNIIQRGDIIGLIGGPIEIGPRALGRRSILCDPSFPEMKDILNSKVKRRESFRPFAPVCRLEDVHKYFDSNRYDDLQYMSYAIKVKDKYKRRLSSITHEDGTARVQTVTKDQNELLYDMLTLHGGVLLNTSLNVQGKPILNSVEEALYMVNNTGLDAVVINHKNKLHIIK